MNPRSGMHGGIDPPCFREFAELPLPQDMRLRHHANSCLCDDPPVRGGTGVAFEFLGLFERQEDAAYPVAAGNHKQDLGVARS